MMAAVGPPSSQGFLPLLESLEDNTAGQPEQTDAYLTIANRLSGEEGRQFFPAVEKHFSRLGKAILAHISSPNAELSQAALQALGFCVYHSHIVSGVSETFLAEILSALCSLVVKSTEKNTCTRALWVISKQSFPPDVVAKKAALILGTLESVLTKEEIQSVVLQHEALNVIIRLLEQVPTQMGDGAVQWAKLVIPLVVHSASKVRLRAAAALEMGLPLLLQKQKEVAAVIEPMMSTKLIPELQKLFTSKNETNVLKLWPLFVKLLGKLLHRGGPFINSLLHLEELGFRSSSPTVKKIAFIAWKSLIDNFALNPDILCSAKRMKLLMQPLMSIHVRTEALLLTKVEVWWYLVIQLGPNLSSHFDQVSVPLLQYTIGSESSSLTGTPSRPVTQNGASTPVGTKSAPAGFNSPANTSRMSLNSSVQVQTTFPSIQLLGLEMLLHYFLGPEVVAKASKNKVTLSLEPLKHPLTSGSSSFTKHAAVLISNMKDGFISVGKGAPESLLVLLWKNLVHFVNVTIESGSIKKDRQGCEVLTLMLQALESIITSEALPADRVLVLFECTVKGISHRVLGSASYQVGKMDVLNGTPALFLILLLYNSSMLASYIEDERFYQCLQTLVDCGLSGPTSPLAFAEAVLGAIGRSATYVQNKEQLWRMWSVVVGPLTDTITQSNEVNQGDALEHNFSALHTALLFPINHLLCDTPLQQATQKSMLLAWSKLYKVFARCSALVATAEENICCEELCAKMATKLNKQTLMVPSTLNAVASILQVMVECVDFSPYTPQFQQKLKSPHTPVNRMRKRNKVLGNLSTLQSLLLQCLDLYLEDEQASSEATGIALVSILSTLFANLLLPNAVMEALTSFIQSLSVLYKRAASELPKFSTHILTKLEKLLSDILSCLQSHSTLAYDEELLGLLSPLLCVLFPHKIKPLRTSITHFWNSTFAKSVTLSYPEELRPILSHVKQNTPIILPGFEACSVSDELSAQYSSEGSQLETKLSGVPVSSVGKRDSLLTKTPDPKDKGTTRTIKPVSTKLDFGSPKPPRREALEEEASIDFVFIPPETKERVLTEHQKEMKRTKRVDIPAMYNNLDASLDTTVFSQYTQSQEDSMGKLPTEQADEVAKEASGKASREEVAMEQEAQETQDFASPKPEQDKETQNAMDVSLEDEANSDIGAADMDVPAKEGTSPNISGCSDLVSGTPQKSSSSRRQSFITLEKYAEGKPASPIAVSSFTGPLAKTSGSQELGNDSTPSPQAMQKASSQNSDDCSSSKTITSNSQQAGNNAMESPHRPKESLRNIREPVKLTDRMPSESTEDEDMIPDTQTGVEVKDNTALTPTLEAVEPPSSEGQSQQDLLDDSQSSVTDVSPGEPRRSGRARAKSQLLGEAPDSEGKNAQLKRRRSEGNKSDSQTLSTPQSRPNTRSKLAIEEENSKVRTRAQRDKSESSQSNSQGRSHRKMKLYSSSGDFLDSTEPKRRSSRALESSQSDLQSDSQSDYESQSQGRRRGRPKSSLNKEEVSELKKEVLPEKQLSQTVTQDFIGQTEENKTEIKTSSQIVSGSSQTDGQSCTGELVEQTEKDASETKTNSQNISTSPQKDDQSLLEMQIETDKSETKIDSPMATATPIATHQSQLDEQTETDKIEPKIDTTMAPVSPVVSDQSQPKSDNADSQVIVSSPANESQGRTNTAGQLVPETEDPANVEEMTVKEASVNLSQEESQEMTPESSGSQTLRRGRSKALSEAAEDKKESPDTSRRQSRSSSQANLTPASQVEVASGGRTRRSKSQEEQSKQSPSSTPENSQSLESTESSQGRGRYSKRRSSQVLASGLESSESESSENREEALMPRKRGRRSRTQPPTSPLTIESQDKIVNDIANVDSDIVQKEDSQGMEAIAEDSEVSQKQDLEGSQPLEITSNTEEKKEEQMDVEVDAVPSQPVVEETTETEGTNDGKTPSASPSKKGRKGRSPKVTPENQSSQESVTEVLESSEKIETVGLSDEPIQETLSCEPSDLVSSDDAAETLQVPEETLQEKIHDTVEPQDEVTVSLKEPETQNDSVCLSNEQVPEECEVPVEEKSVPEECEVPVEEKSVPVEEEPHSPTLEQNESEPANVDALLNDKDQSANEPSEETAGEELASMEECDKDKEIKEGQDEEHIQTVDTENDLGTNLEAAPSDPCTASEPATDSVFQDSPAKQKDLEAAMVSDVVQSPSSGRIRGTWSPSASPSTSILKKGQKRCLEEETPSPLVKSRRVSFANPIQMQETADDIDRRSPALRTSSPRRSRVSSIPQPKYITTPTKSLLVLSPRNLHSPGHKSSKKCLISEMSQEPRPLSKDCIYPALVGCTAPVEAVLPQISSNMWSRGFGQLVRARNIKTVGDLSALTPTKVKSLPIRSPKLSNVKKALRLYELQRKGRGVEELKSFDETEMLTSELEDTRAAQNHEEGDKTSVETLATELVDEPLAADVRTEESGPVDEMHDSMVEEPHPEGRAQPEGLPSEVEALNCRVTPLELGLCSPEQLVHMHDQLGGMMRRVVVELQTRLGQNRSKP